MIDGETPNAEKVENLEVDAQVMPKSGIPTPKRLIQYKMGSEEFLAPRRISETSQGPKGLCSQNDPKAINAERRRRDRRAGSP